VKPALLLLPGLLCDEAVWHGQVAALSDRYACHVADYRALDSLPAMAEQALAGMAEAGDRFALAGHSMGGRVAFEILRRAPQRVSQLILMDTGYLPRGLGEHGAREAEQRQRLVALAYSHGMRSMGREWLRGMVPERRWQDAELIEAILAMVERKTPEIHEAQVRALLTRPDASDVLPRIACPTLLLCGREDLWSPLARHEEMARLIPGARLGVIEQSGHMSTMECPDQVNATLRTFL
jgi:pimeloyl-ACP methyl ester carboxylesterase